MADEPEKNPLDFSDGNISQMELDRRNRAWGEARSFSDDQREEVQLMLEELYAVVNTSDTIMPPLEKFMRLVDISSRGAATASPDTNTMYPSDILHAAYTVSKHNEMAMILQLAADGDEQAMEYIQHEIRRRMQQMGFPQQMIDTAMIVAATPEEMQQMLENMGAENTEDVGEGGPSKKALDLLLGRDPQQ